MLRQGLQIVTIVRVHGDAQRRRHHQFMLADLDGGSDRLDQLARQVRGPVGIGVGQDQHEFVPAHARHGVLLAHLLAHAPRHRNQQFIANAVPQRVVDVLEMIQIEEHQRQRFAVALGQAEVVCEAVAQQGPVGQAGQQIEMRHPADALLVGLALADIGEDGDEMRGFALGVGNPADGEPLRIYLAVLALVPHLALPQMIRMDAAPHAAVERCIVPPRRQDARVAPLHLFGGVPGDGGEGRIDQQNFVVRIRHHDAVVAVREHLGCQALLRLGSFSLDGTANEMGHALHQGEVVRVQTGLAPAVHIQHAQHLAGVRHNGYGPARRQPRLMRHGVHDRAQGAIDQRLRLARSGAEIHPAPGAVVVRGGRNRTGLCQQVLQGADRLRCDLARGLVQQPDHTPVGGQQLFHLANQAAQDLVDVGIAGNLLQRKGAQGFLLVVLVLDGEVHGGARHPHRYPGGISGDKAAGQYRHIAAGLVAQPQFLDHHAVVRAQHALVNLPDLVQILGMDARLEPHRPLGHVIHAVTQHVPALRRIVDRLGDQVAVPGCIGGALEHQFQLRLRLAQPLFGALALGLMFEVAQRKVEVRGHLGEEGLGVEVKTALVTGNENEDANHFGMAMQRKSHHRLCVGDVLDPDLPVFPDRGERTTQPLDAGSAVRIDHLAGLNRAVTVRRLHHQAPLARLQRANPRQPHAPQGHGRLADAGEQCFCGAALDNGLVAGAQGGIQVRLALDFGFCQVAPGQVLQEDDAAFAAILFVQGPQLQADIGFGAVAPANAAVDRIGVNLAAHQAFHALQVLGQFVRTHQIGPAQMLHLPGGVAHDVAEVLVEPPPVRA